jgi:glutamate formiminotransferase / 5-formyltetrahydrofolate cyclo-ligase
VSEGRDRAVIDAIAEAAGDAVLDVHTDGDHHRSVITLAGALAAVEAATRCVVDAAVTRIDLRRHAGAHPRLGAADVVPVVPLRPGEATWLSAVDARDRLAKWIGTELSVPCFLYGLERTLPEVRRAAFRGLDPDTGPDQPHPTAGATAVGVRRPLIAYNLWLEAATESDDPGSPASPASPGIDLVDVARDLAAWLRSPSVRALGLPVAGGAQVSCNLLVPSGREMEAVFDTVSQASNTLRCRISQAEVVGLIPGSALAEIPRHRWLELGVGEDLTIEARWTDPRLRSLRSDRTPGPSRPDKPRPG